MAKITERRSAQKDLDKVPNEVVKAYEIWARLVEGHGAVILRTFKGYHDEKLSGVWDGYRSSRLSRKWRVIYARHRMGIGEVVEVYRVTPHDYRR